MSARLISGLLLLLSVGCEFQTDAQDLAPLILHDRGHNNWAWKPEETDAVMHRYLAGNSFRVKIHHGAITREALEGVHVFKSDNAFPPGDNENWTHPATSAFTTAETKLLEQWVAEGGSLLVVVEHMPFPAAYAELLGEFGVETSDGFALDRDRLDDLSEADVAEAGYLVFRHEDGSLADHPVLSGGPGFEKVEFLTTDVGAAFRLPDNAVSLVTLGTGMVSLETGNSWVFGEDSVYRDVVGWSQAGIFVHGKGKVAVLGDSFLYTSPEFLEPPYLEKEKDIEFGKNNHVFTLNILRWLTGRTH